MCIIVNKMDWEKRKKMAYGIGKVQTLCTALLVRVPRRGNTRSALQPTEERALGTSSRRPSHEGSSRSSGRLPTQRRTQNNSGPGERPPPALAAVLPCFCRRTLQTEKDLGKERLRFNPDSSGPPSPYSPSFIKIERTHVPISHLLEGSCGVCADSLNTELWFEYYLHIPGRRSATVLKIHAREDVQSETAVWWHLPEIKPFSQHISQHTC